MLGELVNQIIPFAPIFRRRDVLLVPESVGGILGRQFLRHETQLDKGTHAVLQETVVDLVDVGEVVNRMALAVLVVNAHVIEENRVEADDIPSP